MFLTLLFILNSYYAQAIDIHHASECPDFSGQYLTSQGHVQVIKTTLISNGASYVFDLGIKPIYADAAIHNLDNGASYVSRCDKNKLNIKMFFSDQVVNTLHYQVVNEQGDLQVVSVGAENYDEVLIKK